MTQETAFPQKVKEKLDQPELDRQTMAARMLKIFENNKALLDRFNAKEKMEQLADEINKRGYFAQVVESPPPQTKPEDTWGGYLCLGELNYRVRIECGVNEESEKDVFEVIGLDSEFDFGGTISFMRKDEWGNPFSVNGLNDESFGNLLLSNFLRPEEIRKLF